MNENPTVEVTDVQIRTKLPKKTKTNKDYWIFESNKGSLMCFDPSTAQKINPSESTRYTFSAEDYAPDGQHKNYTIKKNGLVKMTEVSAPAPAERPAESKQYSEAPTQKAWGGGGTGMNGDLARDTRISKLSVFAAVAQLQAAKMKVDPAYGANSVAAIVCDTMDLTNAVLTELIYPAAKPAPVPVSEEPPFLPEPAPQTYQQPVPAPAAVPSQPMPAATPRPAAVAGFVPPAPAPTPVVAQTPADKTAQAKQLFGVKTDMESQMAARVAKMLNKTP